MNHHFYFHTSEDMYEVSDNSVELIIFDPPYTNSLDGKTLDKSDYISFLKRVAFECERTLNDEGILVTINTDLRDHRRYNKNNSKFDGLIWQKHSDIKQIFEELGFLCFDTKIWVKSLKINRYRYNYSYIQFFVKSIKKERIVVPNDITNLFVPSVWFLKGTPRPRLNNKRVFMDGLHPELVVRCILALTKSKDIVLSPFLGVGTVMEAAYNHDRASIGYEIDKDLFDYLIKKLPYAEFKTE
jgi:DNA modification methylase